MSQKETDSPEPISHLVKGSSPDQVEELAYDGHKIDLISPKVSSKKRTSEPRRAEKKPPSFFLENERLI